MASISGNGAKGHHKFTLEVTESYVSNGADNYSNVDFKFKISSLGGGWDWYGWGSNISYTINVNGNKYTGTIPDYDGNSTVTLKSVTGIKIPHNDDGTKSITFSFGVTDGAGQRYTCGDASGSGSMTLTKIPRYGTSNQSFKDKTETTITMNWSSDNTVDYIWYSKDNGSNWTGVDVTDGTSGTYTISGLSANTSYNIKTRIRRKDSQLTTDSSALSVTTYDYPYCTSSPNFVIGEGLTLSFYNPLDRSITVKLLGNNDAVIGGWTGKGTTIKGFNDSDTINDQYNSIPSTTSSKYKVQVTYNGVTKTRNNGNTYSINTNNCIPTFSNFTYKDTNTTVTGVTGNDQILVKGLSTLQVTVSSANKMVAKNGANPSKYIAVIDTLNKSVNYSTSDINLAVGTVINSGTKRLTVTAYDSRTISKAVYKDITVYDYNKPVVNVSLTRLNNFEAETTLKVSGTYSRLTIDGSDKNTVTGVKYRYRESGGTWSDWVRLTTTVTSGKYTCNDLVLSLDNTKSFDFQIQVIDKFSNDVTSKTLDVGEAIFFISTNNKACYINGNQIIPTGNAVLYIDSTNGFNIVINKTETSKIPIVVYGVDNSTSEPVFIVIRADGDTTKTTANYKSFSGGRTVTRKGTTHHIDATQYSVYWVMSPPRTRITLEQGTL